MEEKNEIRAFISIEEWLDENKRFNLNMAVLLLSFSTMLFHFAVVFFFAFKLESLILVWIFLWIWNFLAFLFDVPIGILQYYYKSKTLLWSWAIAQIIAILIFANFILWVTDFIAIEAWSATWSDILEFFLWDLFNWVLLTIAAILYWFNREINDITLVSYILSKANPSQYKTIIAQKNLFFGIWSLLWLIFSWVILTFSPNLIIFSLLIILGSLAFVSINSFDSKEKAIKLENIKNYKVYFDKNYINKTEENINNKTNSIIKNVKSIDLKSVIGWVKYIFMKPINIRSEKITKKELIYRTKKELINIYETLKFAKNSRLIVYWSFYMLLIFGFWDTFASTFLLDFLDQLKKGWSYLLLWIIAIPAFWLQEYFWKLSDKIWVYKVANVWLAISGISLIIMSFFASWELNLFIILILAIINSVWYAIWMWLSVPVFLESYNKTYAIKNNMIEIDWNASAAPMKILQNLANVIWLIFWWFILSLSWYSWFFFLFGTLIIWLLFWSIKVKDKVIR